MTNTVRTYSNAAYLLAGAAVLCLDPGIPAAIVGAALAFLSVASFQMHRLEDWGPWPSWESADHAAMHAVYAAVAAHAVSLPWPLIALAAVAAPVTLEVALNADHERPMGVYILVTLVGAVAAGEWLLGGIGAGVMGLGFVAWIVGGDLEHGLWHVLTALGTVFLYLVGA